MENLNGAFKWFYDAGNWLFKLMYLHLLWAVFTLAGLIVLGLFPATAGVFSVIRKWVDRDYDISIYQTFMETYKSSFLKINGIGYVMVFIGLFLQFDYLISKQLVGSLFIHIVLLIFILLYFLTLFYLFPLFVHVELKPLQYIKQSLFLMLASPLHSFGIILSIIVIYYLFVFLPVVLIMLGVPLVAYPMMHLFHHAFNRVQQKKSA